jgi:glycosyltransferase involved in cell wall biosynthesis
MKIILASHLSRFPYMTEFSNVLNAINIDTKIIFDSEISDGFPSRKISHWVQSEKKFIDLIQNEKPDLVFLDRPRHLGLACSKHNIPFMVFLRGDFWSEINISSKTNYNSFLKKKILKKWEIIGERNFQNSKAILPICQHLDNIVKNHYPKKSTHVLYQGIELSNWYNETGMELKHPCVGIIQGAVIWDKVKEMLNLVKVLEKMPEVNFYWVGDGPHKEKILTVLEKYENFHWLGPLNYPSGVRKFLTEIDICALVSGLDMLPRTIQEAQAMKKPIIATNVGGIPELIKNGENGFLIKKNDPTDFVDKIELILNDNKIAKKIANKGYECVKENFDWQKIAWNFKEFLKKV